MLSPPGASPSTVACGPFGYLPDKITPDPVEGPLVQRAYADALAGVTVSAIRTRWNRQGVVTINGKPWDLPKVEKVCAVPVTRGWCSTVERSSPA